MAKTIWKILLILMAIMFGQNKAEEESRIGRQLSNVQSDIERGNQRIYSYTGHPNLVPYGTSMGDLAITNNQQVNGMTIQLYHYFPFYGAIYNYTMISTNGYIGFAHFSDFDHDLRIGMETNWPRESDPALIAPYLCKQRVDISGGRNSKVYYRLEMRTNSQSAGSQLNRVPCQGKLPHVQCNAQSNLFLDHMQRLLQEGVAGASAFRAHAALVVTWENLRPNIGSERVYSTYQLVWLTDASSTLSYTVINYDTLGYDAADLNGNTVTGRCKAVFNGGNHTGSLPVNLSSKTKERPSSLAERSSVPHVVRGRYLHRVDDIVRPVGCSNKTGGTFNINIYPNIVNMFGEVTVEVNAMCLSRTQTYTLMIEQREAAPCDVLNPSIARCHLPKILDWGTKTVYFQPQSGFANDEKAYIGYIYFVPPTIDPMRLDIGNIHDWFHNPVQDDKELIWYPRNFTNLRTDGPIMDVNNPALYQMQLGLYVIGYKETRDDDIKKFRPKHRVLARLATYTNSGDEKHRWNPQKARINLNQVEQWYLRDSEEDRELFSYRFGYLKLSPLPVKTEESDMLHLSTGLMSAPISIHWLWTLRRRDMTNYNLEDIEQKINYVKKISVEMCREWFNEDGALPNFIRDTELNASCPCKEEQAKLDLGRFMPHPRCSQAFRDVMCTETLGSRNCYMSAQNVRTSRSFDSQQGYENSYATHYGQVCCYDSEGYLMQTSYQPVIKIDDSTPYSPGFPMRAYEFGTKPYQGMFEIPGFSAFYHDMMPYYFCCKYADFRCQMFYWRRPSSGCQHYEPPAIGTISGAGLMTTLKKQKFIFNEPGIYNLLYGERTMTTPEFRIQVRMERFPDRSVDFAAANQEQSSLVQPSNATVITGIAVECSDSDRVHVILRKDTRRRRYRTTILVNDVVRYFDNMQLQRFKGITIFINTINQGQSIVYVVLNKAQIGIRIRESYGLDMDRIPTYFESFGLLDLLVSVPPQYQQSPTSVHRSYQLHLLGLLNPTKDVESLEEEQTLSWNDVNNPSIRNEFISKYRIKSEAEFGTTSLMLSRRHDPAMHDLFETNSDSAFNVLPDANLKKPVYLADPRYRSGSHAFIPQTFQTLENFKRFCKEYYAGDLVVERQYFKELRRCPTALKIMDSSCANDIVCFYDGVLLQSTILAETIKNDFNTFILQRSLATVHYNSCGPINLEYPEFMVKGPSSAAHAYLEGDVALFSCFQDHVSKGDNHYQCNRQTYQEDTNIFVMRWNEGAQPWCRSRQKENFLMWLFWIFVFIAILFALLIIFTTCWLLKQRRLAQNDKRSNKLYKRGYDTSAEIFELQPLQIPSTSPKQSFTSASSLNANEKPMKFRSSSQPSLQNSVTLKTHPTEPLTPTKSSIPVRRRSSLDFNTVPPPPPPQHSSIFGLTTGV